MVTKDIRFGIKDFELVKEEALKCFEEAIESANQKRFDMEFGRLESQVVLLYRLVALASRHEPDMKKTAELWNFMMIFCDLICKKIKHLSKKYHPCQASYDNILDIRNQCRELRDLHS